MSELVLTRSGYRQLRAELDVLERERRREVAARLQEALELAGDLGDNPEYLDALREQEELERRIDVLQEQLASARVVDAEPRRDGPVGVGSWAELEDLDTGDRSRFVIVGSPEANPTLGRLSIESPVGSAVVGHRVGDRVEVRTPHGLRHLRIVGAGSG